MIKAMSLNTEQVSGNTPSEYDLEFARKEFKELYEPFKGNRNLMKLMAAVDDFYNSRAGFQEFGNVKAGRSSLGPTKRAVSVITKVNERKADKVTYKKTRAKNQKLHV